MVAFRSWHQRSCGGWHGARLQDVSDLGQIINSSISGVGPNRTDPVLSGYAQRRLHSHAKPRARLRQDRHLRIDRLDQQSLAREGTLISGGQYELVRNRRIAPMELMSYL